ncbi:hypothetical protein CEXT_155021 [Caerostris extrusa]|uniref:Uncharacterized protein n=1 Tax=Caerostris extrusa TaxID=172846 RepID=A0AAV4MF98_CAEEX|nr:hypothetical protein CEXT_155021 [Caerostris extrusa]
MPDVRLTTKDLIYHALALNAERCKRSHCPIGSKHVHHAMHLDSMPESKPTIHRSQHLTFSPTNSPRKAKGLQTKVKTDCLNKSPGAPSVPKKPKCSQAHLSSIIQRSSPS